MNELTVNDYLDNLELDRQDMINSLKSKGVELSDSATFTELVPKIDGLVDINEYMSDTISAGSGVTSEWGWEKTLLKFRSPLKINGTDATYMFRSYPLSEIPQLDTSNINNMYGMFYDCKKLITIPELDTSNVTNMSNIFNGCTSLTTIPQLDTSKVINIRNFIASVNSITTIGGFINLGQAYSTTQSANYSYYRLEVSSSSNITHDSLMNIINNLYDIATKGCNTQQLILGSTNLAKLTEEEIAIATNKGWTVS